MTKLQFADDGYEFGLILSEDDEKGGWTTTWDIEVPLEHGFPGGFVNDWIQEHLNLPADVDEARDDPRCHISEVIGVTARIYAAGTAQYDKQANEMVMDIDPEVDPVAFTRGAADDGYVLSLCWHDEWTLVNYGIPANSPINQHWMDLEEWVVNDYLDVEITDEPDETEDDFYHEFARAVYDAKSHSIIVEYIDL